MGSLVPFPTRPAVVTATPHRIFRQSIASLALAGQEASADMAAKMAERALRFPLADGRPHPEHVALAMKELQSVPSELAAPYRHARAAAKALFDLAFPDTIPPEVA
jgi:hypothetical protein